MSVDRDALYAKAKKGMKARKQAEEKRKSGGNYEFEKTFHLGLELGKFSVFRIHGFTVDSRVTPYDPKEVFISKIIDDKGKRRRIIAPEDVKNSNWLLWKVSNKVLEGYWDNEKKEKIFKNKNVCPSLFNQVRFNNQKNNKFEKGWRPSHFVMLNVIDRLDPEFHAENKQTKILSKSCYVFKDSNGQPIMEDGIAKMGYEDGIPMFNCYNIMEQKILAYYGLWDNYDIIIRKNRQQPFYDIFHPSDNLLERMVSEGDLSKEIYEMSNTKPMTEEEKNYKRFDFDKLYKVSSYQKIAFCLGDFIKKVDAHFKTSFYDELQNLVSKEKYDSGEDEEIVEPSKSEIVERKVLKVKPSFDPSKLDFEKYKGIPYLNEEELSVIVGVDENDKLIFSDKREDGSKIKLLSYEHNEIEYFSPDFFSRCPYTGYEFE